MYKQTPMQTIEFICDGETLLYFYYADKSCSLFLLHYITMDKCNVVIPFMVCNVIMAFMVVGNRSHHVVCRKRYIYIEGTLFCPEEMKRWITRRSNHHRHSISSNNFENIPKSGCSTASQPTSWMLEIKTNPVLDTIFQLTF